MNYYVHLSLETLRQNTHRWFGNRASADIPTSEIRRLFEMFCDRVSVLRENDSLESKGLSLTFVDQQQCTSFFNRFLLNHDAIWLTRKQVVELMVESSVISTKSYRLFMFDDGAILGFEYPADAFEFKMKLS